MTDPQASTPSRTTIRVMTYNIRLDTSRDGQNAWPHRSSAVVRLIVDRCRPDLLGLQEALPHQLEEVARGTPDLDWVGVARDDGRRLGEFTPVFYRRDRFALLESETFWLSETPEVPGSRSWDAQLNRIATWARLRDRQSGCSFCLVNTHLEYNGLRARTEGARLLRSRLPQIGAGAPLLLTGDFNCREGSEPYRLLTDDTPGEPFLFDARYRALHPHAGPTASTITNFATLGEPESRIDYLFVTKDVQVLSHRIVEDRFGPHYPSDHLPVLAEVVIARPEDRQPP